MAIPVITGFSTLKLKTSPRVIILGLPSWPIEVIRAAGDGYIGRVIRFLPPSRRFRIMLVLPRVRTTTSFECKVIEFYSAEGTVGNPSDAIAPPSTGITAPFTKSDASEARKTAMPKRSSLLPARPIGMRFFIFS